MAAKSKKSPENFESLSEVLSANHNTPFIKKSQQQMPSKSWFTFITILSVIIAGLLIADYLLFK